MKRIRQGFIAAGLAAMLLCGASCARQTETGQSGASYVVDFYEIPDTVTGIKRLLIKDDTAYLCCTEETGSSYLASMTADGGEFQKLPLELEASDSLLDFAFDSKGGTWTVCMDAAGGYRLKEFDKNGMAVQDIDLTQALDKQAASEAGRELFLSIDAKGNMCVAEKSGNTSAYLFDQEGRFLFSIQDEGNLMTTITTAEGQIGVCAASADRMNYDLLFVDMESRSWKEDRIHLGAAAGLYGGVSSSFYRFDSSSLYGYAAGAQEGTHILNWSDAGLSASEARLGELSDGRLLVIAASPDQTGAFSYEMAVLSRGTDERAVLSMVSLSAGPGIVQAVSDFNKTSSRYRVELTEYFPYEQDVSDEDWDHAVLNLNTRIISGDMPDILDMSNLPVRIYQSKGLLEDLYPYMENDQTVRMDDYFENVFQAISVDGKLPYLTDGVSVSTMLADADIMKDKTGWTLQDFEELQKACGPNSISNLSGPFFLKIMLQTDSSFVDWACGTCSFDSPEFIELLECAGTIQDGGQSGYGGELDGVSAAAYEAVHNLYQIAGYRDYYHGNLKLLGLPGSGGEYHALIPEVKIGISSAGRHKEGAWEFVRTFLTEEHQRSCLMLPVNKRAFDTVMRAAVEGKSVWTPNYETVKAATEDVELTRRLLSSAAYVMNDNQTLENIVLEEAEEYFSGAENAKEAAEKIQSRADIYMKEQK